MSIFKRGNVYWYHFWFNGQHIQESTKQGNPRVARNMESAHRTALAKGEVGLREKKPVPTLKEFIENRFEPWAKAQFEKTSPATWRRWYRYNLDLWCAVRNEPRQNYQRERCGLRRAPSDQGLGGI